MNSVQGEAVSSGSDNKDENTGGFPRVALFVTCLVDLFRPTVGFAAVRLLENAGCVVEVPQAQTCCGQPAYNAGARSDAQAIARQVVATFETYDFVVAPSGSCAGMLRRHYPDLLGDDAEWGPRAVNLAKRTHELMSFLVDVCGVESVAGTFQGTVAYHDSCSNLRDLGVRDQPRKLLATLDGLNLQEVPESEACCGFGGSFSVKYGPISTDIVARKVEALSSVKPDIILGGDLGCLLNIAGKMQRDGNETPVRHAAEVLVGMTENAAIGAPEREGA